MRGKIAVKNIISLIIVQILGIICGIVIPRLIIQTYGSNTNGLIVSISKFLAYITIIEVGFASVLRSTLYKPIADNNTIELEKILKSSEKFFRRIAYIFCVYTIGLCVFMPIMLSDQFDAFFIVSMIIIIALNTFIEYYFEITYRLFLYVAQKTSVISGIQTIALVLNTIIIVILIKLGANVQIVKLATVFIFMLKPILQLLYIKKHYKISLKNVKGDYKIEKRWDGLAAHVAYVVHNNIDVVVLSLCTSIAEVSVYSVYLLIVKSIKTMIQGIASGMEAVFGDMIAKGEKSNVQKQFRLYEIVYFTIVVIAFSSALVLIIPFIKIYTRGIVDVDYIRPLLAFVIIIAELIWVLRLPYNGLSEASGYFKETRKGAWLEAFLNITISIILVWNLGIVGVAIGTLIAITIRSIEFMFFTSKKILDRKLKYIYQYLGIIALEFTIIAVVFLGFFNWQINSYIQWGFYACFVVSISTLIVVLINASIFRKETKDIIKSIKKIIYTSKKIKYLE